MALPSPLPDNPKRWEGWRSYNSENLYERLCLSFDSSPSNEQIESNCRQLLVWWQKKLPLKNQPSNPVTQMLRAGLDEAAQFLAEARTKLLDPAMRERIDETIRIRIREQAIEEFFKFLSFATANGCLNSADEKTLYQVGESAGLTAEEMKVSLDEELERRGVKREEAKEAPVSAPAAVAHPNGVPLDVFDEFRRLLRLSGLNDDDMTDDQRDALCNMGENLGLSGGQAEDLIDEFLESTTGLPVVMAKPAPAIATAVAVRPTPRVAVLSPKVEESFTQPVSINVSPLARSREREENPDYVNVVGMEMKYVPSGNFRMGSDASDAMENEQPVGMVTVSGCYVSRLPITNRQYEEFEPAHQTRRAPWAGDDHPVVYVSSDDAIRFAKWLSAKERREYRLPTEAEWEFAARGMEGWAFPWGDRLDNNERANFADANKPFAWADARFNCGFPHTSPVGSFPKGASACGIEDMAGNVWEWCLDFFEAYKGKDRVNPRGPTQGTKRICRGGSWKSRAQNMRATARGFNLPNFSSNDVGFRLVCEVKN